MADFSATTLALEAAHNTTFTGKSSACKSSKVKMFQCKKEKYFETGI